MADVALAFDDARWKEALEKLRPLLRFIARRELNCRFWKRADPSDMVQKTLLEAHEKRADFRGASEKELAAWLEIILDHRIKDEIRRLRCGKNDIDLEVGGEKANDQVRTRTSPLSAVVRHEEVLRLAEALEKLSEDERLVVEAIHFDERTLGETAELMGSSKDRVARLLRRALSRLLDLLR